MGSAFFQQATGATSTNLVTPESLPDFLLQTVFQVLSNPIQSLAQGRILPIVFFALLLGVALLQLGERAETLTQLIRQCQYG